MTSLIHHPFWCVSTATPESELCDVLFQADAPRLMLQSLGGLKHARPNLNDPRERYTHGLVGLYLQADADDAVRHAIRELRLAGARLPEQAEIETLLAA